jgi:hypothetical protein
MLRVFLVLLMTVSAGLASTIWDWKRYPTPVRSLRGQVIGEGAVNPGVQISIYDIAEGWADDSIPVSGKRRGRPPVLTLETDEDGRFEAKKRMPKGIYEVEFEQGGWDILSVITEIDPDRGAKDRLCVTLRISSAGHKHTVEKCQNR